MTAKEKIDEYIGKANDWRGDLVTEIRELIHEVEPEMVEEWKWNSPVFSYKGKMVCSPGAFKNHVRLFFVNGAMLEDSNGLFNSGTDAKNARSINYKNGDKIDREALKILLVKAIEYNQKLAQGSK